MRVVKKHVNSEHVRRLIRIDIKILKSMPKITKKFPALSVEVDMAVLLNFRQTKEPLDVLMTAAGSTKALN